MVKRILLIALAAILGMSTVSCVSEGKMGPAAVGVVFTLLVVFFIVRSMKKRPAAPAPAQQPAERKPVKVDPTVYATASGSCYHENKFCDALHGSNASAIKLSDARAKYLKPCKTCYPYGDRN